MDDDVPSLAVPATKMEPSVLYTLAVGSSRVFVPFTRTEASPLVQE